MTVAYIGLGSNLNDPLQQLVRALMELKSLPETTVLAQSSFYRSKPVGPDNQPDYINSAAKLDTLLPADRLLQHLLSIEEKHGRIRGPERWQARTLDLDLLLYGQQQIRKNGLVVPHPEISNRNFVLIPLLEMAPDLYIPGKGRVNGLLTKIGMADIEKLKNNK